MKSYESATFLSELPTFCYKTREIWLKVLIQTSHYSRVQPNNFRIIRRSWKYLEISRSCLWSSPRLPLSRLEKWSMTRRHLRNRFVTCQPTVHCHKWCSVQCCICLHFKLHTICRLSSLNHACSEARWGCDAMVDSTPCILPLPPSNYHPSNLTCAKRLKPVLCMLT